VSRTLSFNLRRSRSADSHAQEPTPFAVDIVLPLPFRLALVAFVIIWSGLGLLIVVLAALTFWPVAMGALAVVAVVTGIGVRFLRLRVQTGPDALIVHNHFRTYRVARSDIEDFVIAREGGATIAPHGVGVDSYFVIEALLRDGKALTLDATRRPRIRSWPRRRLDTQLAALRAWTIVDRITSQRSEPTGR
jgi:hypothetical protein